MQVNHISYSKTVHNMGSSETVTVYATIEAEDQRSLPEQVDELKTQVKNCLLKKVVATEKEMH